MGEALRIHLQAGAHGLQDAHIGLVQRVEIHILGGEVVGGQHVPDIPEGVGHREPVDLLALHLQVLGRGGIDGEGAVSRRGVRAQHGVAWFAGKADIFNAFTLAHHHAASCVAEQHAGAAVGPVGEAGQRFGTEHQQLAGAARGDQALSHGQRRNEAGAAAVDVHSHALQAQGRLDIAGQGGAHGLRLDGTDQHAVDVLRRHPGVFHGRLAGTLGQGLQRIVRQHPALPYAGSCGYPLVVGLQETGQVVVGDHLLRQSAAGAKYFQGNDLL